MVAFDNGQRSMMPRVRSLEADLDAANQRIALLEAALLEIRHSSTDYQAVDIARAALAPRGTTTGQGTGGS